MWQDDDFTDNNEIEHFERIESIYDLPDTITPSYSSKSRQASHWASVGAVVSTLLDGTALSIPYAFALMGWAAGIVMTILIALLTAFSNHLIITLSKKLKVPSLSEVTEKICGS